MPAIAAVGEGDLPPGAMAFQKLLKYQVFYIVASATYD